MDGNSFGENANGQTIERAVGDKIEITLPENPTTGFHWELIGGGEAMCAKLSDAFNRPPGPPGRGGEHSWEFQFTGLGDCAIELRYRRRWQKPAGDERTFKIRVRVR
jgi:inhibitor of cysteine peptidase